MSAIKAVIFLVLIMTLFTICCNADNALKQVMRHKRGMCKVAPAVCCTFGGTDATCCDGLPCCPWADCSPSRFGR